MRLLAKVEVAQQGSQLNLQRDREHRRRIGIHYKEHWKANGRTNKKLKRKFALELKLIMEKKEKYDMQNAAWEVKKTSLEATFKDKNLQWVSKKKVLELQG